MARALLDAGTVTLRFKIGTDVDDALLRVSNKINEVPNYPENVERPKISATGAATSPVIWTIFKTRDGNATPIATYRTYFEDEVREHLRLGRCPLPSAGAGSPPAP